MTQRIWNNFIDIFDRVLRILLPPPPSSGEKSSTKRGKHWPNWEEEEVVGPWEEHVSGGGDFFGLNDADWE
jgi:hypothetical protein